MTGGDRIRGIALKQSRRSGLGVAGSLVVAASFAVTVLATRFPSLVGIATGAGVAAAVAYTMLTRTLVRGTLEQSGIARAALNQASNETERQTTLSRRAHLAGLQALADGRTPSILIDLPPHPAIYLLSANNHFVVVDEVDLCARPAPVVRLCAEIVVEIYGDAPVRLSCRDMPGDWQLVPERFASDAGAAVRPGALNNIVVQATLQGVDLASKWRQGGWTSTGDGWTRLLQLDFTSLNGEVVEHHHLHLSLRPVVTEGTEALTLQGLEASIRYAHVPERHYRFDEIEA